MLPIDIQHKIQVYLDEVDLFYIDEQQECLDNTSLGNIEWYNMPNIQKFICMDELFTLKSELEKRLSGTAADFINYVRITCKEYAQDEFSPLYRFSSETDNPALMVLLRVVVLIFNVKTANEVLSIFVPSQLLYDLSDTLEPEKYSKTNPFNQLKYRESHLHIEINKKPLTESELELRTSCPDNDTLSGLFSDALVKLLNSVIDHKDLFLFDLSQIKLFGFVMHLKLYTALKEHYPSVEEKLYLRNSEWEVLREKIVKVQYQQENSLRSKLQWLQERLRILGFSNTRNLEVGDQINPILAHFREYLDGFSDEIREQIYNTPVRPKSLFQIMETLPNCTDTAVVDLDFLLAAPGYQALLAKAPDSKKSEPSLIREYTKRYRTAINISAEAQVGVPDQHIQRAFDQVSVYNMDSFVILLGNFSPRQYEVILRTVKLQFIPMAPFHLQALPMLSGAFQHILSGEILDAGSKRALGTVMAKYPNRFGGVEFLAQLALKIQSASLLNELKPKVLELPIWTREALLETKIPDFGIAFELLLCQPKMLAIFMTFFSASESAAWLEKTGFGHRPRIFYLMQYPDALKIILQGMDTPLKKRLMLEFQYQGKSFLAIAQADKNIKIMTTILESFPESERLDIVNQSYLLGMLALDKPEYVKRLIELLPTRDRESAVLFRLLSNRTLISELCLVASNKKAVECIKIILESIPEDRRYPFLTQRDQITDQTILHQVVWYPACIQMVFELLAPQDRRSALACRDRVGRTVESYINNETRQIIIPLLSVQKSAARTNEESESDRSEIGLFFRSKRARVVNDASTADLESIPDEASMVHVKR